MNNYHWNRINLLLKCKAIGAKISLVHIRKQLQNCFKESVAMLYKGQVSTAYAIVIIMATIISVIAGICIVLLAI